MNTIKELKAILTAHAVAAKDIESLKDSLNNPKKADMVNLPLLSHVLPPGIGLDSGILMKNMTLQELTKAYFLKAIVNEELTKLCLGSSSIEENHVVEKEGTEGKTTGDVHDINGPAAMVPSGDDDASEKLIMSDSTTVLLKMVGLEQQKILPAKRKKDQTRNSSSSSSRTSSSSSSSDSNSSSSGSNSSGSCSSSDSSASASAKDGIQKFKDAAAHIRERFKTSKIPRDVLKIIRATAALPESSIVFVDKTVKLCHVVNL